MPRHFIFAMLFAIFSGVLPASAQAPTPGKNPFVPPVHKVKLSASPGTIAQPGVNAPAPVTNTIRVALLLPLTGRNADIGRAMQDAATVALYDKYASLSIQQSTIRVELLPKDTGDTPQQAIAAMNEAVADGVQFVIGPVFADATEAVAPIAVAKNIALLSLSNSVPYAGKGVFAYGFSPQDQTVRVVEYAVKSGKKSIAALVPNSPLGSTVLATAKATLKANGQALVAEASYAPQGLGLDAAVKALMPEGGRKFDALLLPEGGAPLGTMLRTLASHGVTPQNTQFIGTGMWDDAALVRRVPLDGAWLASSPPSNTALFETRFRQSYNYPPPRIASLAYDAVSLAVTIATSGRAFDAATLTSEAGFIGPANGVFRLRPTGKTERSLAVLQINGGAFDVISPAPTAFVGK